MLDPGLAFFLNDLNSNSETLRMMRFYRKYVKSNHKKNKKCGNGVLEDEFSHCRLSKLKSRFH